MQAGHANFVPVAVLRPPSQHRVEQGLPNANFPSDHVSLVCDFAITF